MKLAISALALVLALIGVYAVPIFDVVTFAAPDAAPGHPVEFGMSAGSKFSCGRYTSPLRCYTIPVNAGGSFWLNVNVVGDSAGSGFIQFNKVQDLGQATITSATATLDTLKQPTSVIVNFKGAANDSDARSYSGSATFTFIYFPAHTGESEIGSEYPGVTFSMTSADLKVAYE